MNNRLILRILITASLLLVFLSVPSIASADSVVLWTLTATFSDPSGCGGPSGPVCATASGSFNYDFATNTYSNIHVTTTGGTIFPGATYSGSLLGGIVNSNTGLILGAPGPDLTGPFFALMFDGLGLTDAGGMVSLVPGVFDVPSQTLTGSGELTCNSGCTPPFTDVRVVTTGDVVGTVVTPEPTALSLLGIGLVALLAGGAIRKASQA